MCAYIYVCVYVCARVQLSLPHSNLDQTRNFWVFMPNQHPVNMMPNITRTEMSDVRLTASGKIKTIRESTEKQRTFLMSTRWYDFKQLPIH